MLFFIFHLIHHPQGTPKVSASPYACPNEGNLKVVSGEAAEEVCWLVPFYLKNKMKREHPHLSSTKRVIWDTKDCPLLPEGAQGPLTQEHLAQVVEW